MRARNIKPGFYRNEQLAECSYAARLLFPGLWMLADRQGRLEYRPKRWKGELFPYDNMDTEPLFEELEKVGLVRKYEAGGVCYVWIPTFLAHQNPHCREPESLIPPHPDDKIQDDSDARMVPAPGEHHAGTVPKPCRNSVGTVPARLNPESSSSKSSNTLTTFEYLSPPDGDNAPTGSPDGQEERQEPGARQASPPPCPYEQIRDLYHAALPEHPRVALLNPKRKGCVKARWADAGQRLRALKRPDSAAERLAYFQRLFGKAAACDILTGKKAFPDGGVYRVDFDKLMSPSGFVGVIEGKYDNKPEA